MLCKKCGTDNPINRLYCDNCGTELEHALEDVKAAVDQEIKRDKAKATKRAIRWLLGVSFVLLVIGVLFRGAYKDLPPNDIVPFIAAPMVELNEPPTATTSDFGLGLPAPKVAPPPKATRQEPAFKAQVVTDAFRHSAVSIQAKGPKEPIVALIVNDAVYQFTPTGESAARPVAAADIAALRPAPDGLWTLTLRSLGKPLRGSFADPLTIEFHLLRRTPDGKTATETVNLRNVVEIKPVPEP